MTAESEHIKQCCARLYESELVSRLLGDSFHPGGDALTERLGRLLELTPASHVLDAASGKGTSALRIAERFGCSVLGVDLSAQNVGKATAEVNRLGLDGRVEFRMGDAEHLAVDTGSMDAVMCECAFCTFPDKAQAAREFARVLKGGGRLGLSDVTRMPGPAGEMDDLTAWVACLADAMPAVAYAELFSAAGFTDVTTESHDGVLVEMIRGIGAKLFAAEVLTGLKAIDLAGIDVTEAKRLTRQALAAAQQGRLGYAIMYATKPSRLQSSADVLGSGDGF
jgi:arsenite methyltransferase